MMMIKKKMMRTTIMVIPTMKRIVLRSRRRRIRRRRMRDSHVCRMRRASTRTNSSWGNRGERMRMRMKRREEKISKQHQMPMEI